MSQSAFARKHSNGPWGGLSACAAPVQVKIDRAGQILELSRILGASFKHGDAEDARRTFDKMDTDGNGTVDLDELMTYKPTCMHMSAYACDKQMGAQGDAAVWHG